MYFDFLNLNKVCEATQFSHGIVKVNHVAKHTPNGWGENHFRF